MVETKATSACGAIGLSTLSGVQLNLCLLGSLPEGDMQMKYVLVLWYITQLGQTGVHEVDRFDSEIMCINWMNVSEVVYKDSFKSFYLECMVQDDRPEA
jgi:hypothetical protein